MEVTPQHAHRACIAATNSGLHLSTWARRAVVRAAQAGDVDVSQLPAPWTTWHEDPTTEPPDIDPILWADLEERATIGDDQAAAALLVMVLGSACDEDLRANAA